MRGTAAYFRMLLLSASVLRKVATNTSGLWSDVEVVNVISAWGPDAEKKATSWLLKGRKYTKKKKRGLSKASYIAVSRRAFSAPM